jgi:hypothetical protein
MNIIEKKDGVTGTAAEAPKTLEEMGVPRQLAEEMEAAFRALGATRNGRIVGFDFRTPDGERHPLRVNAEPGVRDRAA